METRYRFRGKELAHELHNEDYSSTNPSGSIMVISADTDGKELRHEKYLNPYHVRVRGSYADGEINEAIQKVGVSQWSLPEGAWERIFGDK